MPSCHRHRLVIPEYKIEKQLAEGDNVIEFTPAPTGTFTYSCWMGMIRSTIKVVENDGAQAALPGSGGTATPEVTEDPGALPISPGGCCGSGVGSPKASDAHDPLPITPGGCCGI